MKVKYLAAVAIASALTVGVVTTGCGPKAPTGGAGTTQPCAGNPCAGNPCAPCAGNPCAGNPCAGNPCAPCAGN
ncbi:MAG: hypothetical protein MJA27_06965 [Pseudanabaenales cyanobacterium]|nr:hypothetical protein [Pseudanabaenales cyanobacterium]